MADLYPFAAAMRAELAAVPWIQSTQYGVAPRRDVAELVRVVREIHRELRAISGSHSDPRTRAVWRETRGDMCEVMDLGRRGQKRAYHARLNTLCKHIDNGLATLIEEGRSTP